MELVIDHSSHSEHIRGYEVTLPKGVAVEYMKTITFTLFTHNLSPFLMLDFLWGNLKRSSMQLPHQQLPLLRCWISFLLFYKTFSHFNEQSQMEPQNTKEQLCAALCYKAERAWQNWCLPDHRRDISFMFFPTSPNSAFALNPAYLLRELLNHLQVKTELLLAPLSFMSQPCAVS